MNSNQAFSFWGDYSLLFIRLVFAFLFIYALILILNFLRDKFILKEISTKKESVSELLLILNKLFLMSGLGFMVSSGVYSAIVGISRNMFNGSVNFGNSLNYLVFGILLIFIGLGFKSANKIADKQKTSA